jgi:hypothetical protein
VRVAVSSGRVLVRRVAVFMGRRGVGLGFVVLALRMVMSRLMMMMGGGLVSGCGILMMLAGRMLRRLGHGMSPPLLAISQRRRARAGSFTVQNSGRRPPDGLFDCGRAAAGSGRFRDCSGF